MTKIIVDSTCDIPEELRERFSISVLPLSVIIDKKAYRDGVDIRLDEVYDALRSGKTPGTSQIGWEETEELFSSVLDAGDDFLYLAFSAAMSGTCRLAELVRDELRPKYPDRRMEIVDSRGGSMGAGLIAIQLGLMNERGVSVEKMLDQCQWMTSHVKYAFTLSDLKCALRGGRLLKTVGNIVSALNLRPVLDVKNGMLHLDKIVRGTKQSLAALADAIANYAGGFDQQIIGMTHADDPAMAAALKKLLQERLPKCTVLCQRIGSVLGVHLGIGGVGVFCMDARPALYRPL